jgi:hypothetical protein
MAFALAYSLGRLSSAWVVGLGQMVRWHGWLNALGFTFLGLLAWTIVMPLHHSTAPGIPFSRLPWRWHTGPDFLHRIGAVDAGASVKPTGIVEKLSDYDREGFSTGAIAEPIIRFYEDTASHDLLVYPEWKRGFRFPAQIYKQISRRLGQMNFPSQPDSDETHITSDIVALRDDLDGREHVRGWVRTYTQTGQAVYVAAYSSHQHLECRYMNIAFPLPLGNLTSVLRLDLPTEPDGGLLLSSYSDRGQDQGVYFVSPVIVVRLPINETIRVYPPGTPYEGHPVDYSAGKLLAEHKMWLFGFHFLTLHYSISQHS